MDSSASKTSGEEGGGDVDGDSDGPGPRMAEGQDDGSDGEEAQDEESKQTRRAWAKMTPAEREDAVKKSSTGDRLKKNRKRTKRQAKQRLQRQHADSKDDFNKKDEDFTEAELVPLEDGGRFVVVPHGNGDLKWSEEQRAWVSPNLGGGVYREDGSVDQDGRPIFVRHEW